MLKLVKLNVTTNNFEIKNYTESVLMISEDVHWNRIFYGRSVMRVLKIPVKIKESVSMDPILITNVSADLVEGRMKSIFNQIPVSSHPASMEYVEPPTQVRNHFGVIATSVLKAKFVTRKLIFVKIIHVLLMLLVSMESSSLIVFVPL